MKKICFLATWCLLGKAFCQQKIAIEKLHTQRDKPNNRIVQVLPKKDTITIIDSMPNALAKNSHQLRYSHHNQKGFDVYQSNIDGMPVLQPDASNRNSLYKSQQHNSKAIQQPYQQPFIQPKPLLKLTKDSSQIQRFDIITN